MKTANQLAEEHWSYIKDLLMVHEENEDVILKIQFHYKTAFIHGYKHSEEMRKE